MYRKFKRIKKIFVDTRNETFNQRMREEYGIMLSTLPRNKHVIFEMKNHN